MVSGVQTRWNFCKIFYLLKYVLLFLDFRSFNGLHLVHEKNAAD